MFTFAINVARNNYFFFCTFASNNFIHLIKKIEEDIYLEWY